MTTLLWVDDNIERFAPFISRFQEHGINVSTGTSNTDGFEKLDSQRFDIVFWDYMMGHEPCANLLDLIVEKANNARVFIVSGFLYLHDVMEQLANKINKSSLRIATIDKTTLPFTEDEDAIKEFLSDIMADNYFDSPQITENVNVIVEEAMSGSEVMTWSSYIELELSAKMAALDKVAEITKDVRQKLEQEGYVYMLFCGDYSEPLHKYKSLDEALDEKQILDMARSLDIAPFEFSVSGIIDDLSANCCPKSGLAGYPILKIGHKGDFEEIHFDTGNPLTLMSYEWYTEKGWIGPLILIQHHTAGDMVFKGKHIKWDDIIVTDCNGVTVCCTFTGFAVCDWQKYRIAVECGPECRNRHKHEGSSKLCKFRTGLLGRNLGKSLDKKISIDFTTGNVTFLEY